ncbi:response regulator transcription factor [Pseudoflavitalea sp. X16]|uniref:response regulator transcription factor n=1 Tax=Paraflavitalea devenefica TaxID=2716334 RepID=UPI00141E6BB9|nr:response regulator transcription factor [Paraflavitalea devenefica]NII29476.1 response regulator transcription factor [Paraflavitalea devenefica]
MKSKILLVEDEIDLGNVVKQYLEIMDFTVDWSRDGKTALEQFRANPGKYDILLLDVSMPEMDGFDLANRIMKIDQHTPFLFLTARNERADRLYGLKIGADDYIAKPFDIDELVLRIRNIIKRNSGHQETVNRALIERGDVKFYKDSLKLIIGNQREIELTPRESELLEFLFNNENKILKREEILTRLWGENDYFLGRSLDVFISRLRKYLSKSNYISISNVYGVGFVFNVQTGKS